VVHNLNLDLESIRIGAGESATGRNDLNKNIEDIV
jgi:hypothetical protein